MYHILVVDDDLRYIQLLKFILDSEGFRVTATASPYTALTSVRRVMYDLIVLDVMMEEMNGLELCRRIRKRSTTPIIFVSARSDITDKVIGLEVGGDDYICKPFHPEELVARIEVALRRVTHRTTAKVEQAKPEILLDEFHNQATIVRTGKRVNLTPTEVCLLNCLITGAGRTMTREQLSAEVWGDDHESRSNELDVYVKRLRAKIEEDPSNPTLLLTVRGIGYKLLPATKENEASCASDVLPRTQLVRSTREVNALVPR